MPRESSSGRIAAAALTILCDEGAEAVTMRRVAAAAGVSPTAAYKHYRNRAALLREVAATGFHEVTEGWGARSEDRDLESRLTGLLDDFLDFALGKPNLYAFLITDRREEARRFPDDFQHGQAPPFSFVAEAVEQGMRAGSLRPDDPLEVTLALTVPAQGLVELYRGGRIGLSETDFRALCKRTTWRVLDGLRG